MNNIIRIRNLTKYYGKHRGIEDLSLDVKKGEIYGFIGPNGAGKSTTIRTMLGLLTPTSGSVSLFGETMSRKKTEILRRIGYMPSEAAFYGGMKTEEVIRFSAKLYGKDCQKEAGELCERLKLDTGKRVEELSLGNRKKVSIVCAFQHDAGLYILDEPTSGLDPLMQKEFFEIVKERNAQGATVFLSSHILGEIQKYCHRAAVIREGRVVIEDEVADICRTSAKRVTVRGVRELAGIHMADKKVSGDGISFLYNGDMKTLLDALSRQTVEDLTITEPDLEEVFLHFYEGGDRDDFIQA